MYYSSCKNFGGFVADVRVKRWFRRVTTILVGLARRLGSWRRRAADGATRLGAVASDVLRWGREMNPIDPIELERWRQVSNSRFFKEVIIIIIIILFK